MSDTNISILTFTVVDDGKYNVIVSARKKMLS